MSQIKATVLDIQTRDSLNIVKFRHKSQELFMVSLSLKDLKPNDNVVLNIKSSHVGLSKEDCGVLSFENQLSVKVTDFDVGKLLCVVKTDFEGESLDSLILRPSFDALDLKKGDDIKALVTATEISIQGTLS